MTDERQGRTDRPDGDRAVSGIAADYLQPGAAAGARTVAPQDAELHVLWLERVARRRDRRAFEQLYGEYAPRVFRFVLRTVRDEARAEEVVNDVMVEVWKAAGKFEGRSSLSTWIFSIARHRALNALRGKRITTTDIDEAAGISDDREDPMTNTDGALQAKLMREALDQLSPEHREVVELTFYQGLNYKEIATITECPENTVKTRMFHARKKLKPILETLGLTGVPV